MGAKLMSQFLEIGYFEVDIPTDAFSLGNHNQASIGIWQPKGLKNSKFADAGVRTLASPGNGLPAVQANYLDTGIFQGLNTADSFASVFESHLKRRHKPFAEFLGDKLYQNSDVLIHAWYDADGQHLKRTQNSLAAVAKQAYVQFSQDLAHLNSSNRVAMKGFHAYAIGTGQTMQALQGKVKKHE
jgi:hypothetical protein